MARFTQIVLIGEKSFLEYNKTKTMNRVFESLSLGYRFVDISSSTKYGTLKKLIYIFAYFKLFLSLGKSERGQILWLSEFKFTLPHIICAKLISKLRGMVLIGGPHSLGADSMLLTNPSYQRSTFSPSQRLKLYLLDICDGLLVRAFNVLQSYTAPYAERAKRLASRPDKLTIIFPIGTSVDRPALAWEPSFKQSGELRLVFWGLANALHGLDVIPPAVDHLRAVGINVKVHIFSPANHFVSRMYLDVKRRNLESQFILDTDTLIRKDYSKVLFADLAISHLISTGMHASAKSLVNALATPNKLFEILGIGMPAIAARTDATIRAFGPDSCIYVEPCSSSSLAQVLESIYQEMVDIRAIAKRGHRIVHAQYSPQSLADQVARQLNSLPESINS